MTQLNSRQRQAVELTEGPLLIVAGPGTGKTRTLVERTAYLMRKGLAEADQITLTTFTNNAAWELRQRISQNLKEDGLAADAARIHIGNFHQLSREVLDRFPQYLDYKPLCRQIDALEQIRMILKNWDLLYGDGGIRRLLPDLRPQRNYYGARNLAQLVNQLREGFADLTAETAETACALSLLARYQQLLLRENCIDYSGLLEQACHILQKHPDALDFFQDRSLYLMVDEYQDTNPIQEEMIRLLSRRSGNVCVVGDDDQSLYRFRGAYAGNLLSFTHRYPRAQRIDLQDNYRSDGGILSFASHFINYPYSDMEARSERLSDRRFKKDLQPASDLGQHKNAVLSIIGKDLDSWLDQLVQAILELRTQLSSYRDMVILSYSLGSAQMLLLTQKLRQAGIPLYAPRQASLMARVEVNRLIACLALAFQPWLSTLYQKRKNLQEPLRELGPAVRKLPVRGQAERKQLIQAFRKDLQAGQANLMTLLYDFMAHPPFQSILQKAMQGDAGARGQARVLAVFLSLVQNYCEHEEGKLPVLPSEDEEILSFCEDFFAGFLPFLRQAKADAMGGEEVAGPEDDRLSLMTIHQSKGLEFPLVILVEPGKRRIYYLKRKRALDRLKRNPSMGPLEDPEQEEKLDQLRLYYTAMTRAKNLLILTGLADENLDEAFQALNFTLPSYRAGMKLGFSFSSAAISRPYRALAYTTDIALYRACPRRWFFFRQLAWPSPKSPQQAYGSLVHESLKQIHRKMLARPEKIRISEIDLKALLQRTAQGLIQSGLPLDRGQVERAEIRLSAYLKAAENLLADRLVAAEQEELRMEEDVIFKGVMDLLLSEDAVLDFKTGRRNEKLEKGYRGQLLFYRMLRGEEGENYLYYLDEEEPLQGFSFSEEEVESFKEGVLATAHAIKKGQVEQRAVDPAFCSRCPLRAFCASLVPSSQRE